MTDSTGCKSSDYTLGFAFDMTEDECQDRSLLPYVGLILKARPSWQAGSLNGIGGHVEEGETPHDGQVREFQEETGLLVPNWIHILTMRNDDWNVLVFKAFEVPLKDMQTMTDEEVGVYSAWDLPSYVLFELRWLIPMALDFRCLPSLLNYR